MAKQPYRFQFFCVCVIEVVQKMYYLYHKIYQHFYLTNKGEWNYLMMADAFKEMLGVLSFYPFHVYGFSFHFFLYFLTNREIQGDIGWI